MNNEKTTNRSDRDIFKKFNMVEFNRIFEENNLALDNKKILPNELDKCNQKQQKPNILFIITCIFIILGIYLLLINNFINFS